jgi:ribosome-associated protein YbcJ (S4-like RNA binding protein)
VGLLIASGLVQVNGEIERRKRRKLYPGDRVATGKNRLKVVTVLQE